MRAQYSVGQLGQLLSWNLTVAIILPPRTFFTGPNNPPRLARGAVKMLNCPWLGYFHWAPPGVFLFFFFLRLSSVCVVFTFIAVTQVQDNLAVFAADGK